MQSIGEWTVDVDLSFPNFDALGWQVQAVDWRSSSVNWDQFNAVYIGVPWDYPEEPDRFMQLLELIDRSSAVLVNDLSLVRWTLAKTYLRDLEKGGVAIVPSLWLDEMDANIISNAFRHFDVDKIILKPVVSTNATDTYLLSQNRFAECEAELTENFRQRPLLVQPFIERIIRDGEYSLFFFDNAYSHAIQKIPQQGDFRVQEEYGAQIASIDANEELQAAASRALALADPSPAYARIDFVQDDADNYLLMELELIEPSMYLRTNAFAPERFARAIDQYVTESQIGE